MTLVELAFRDRKAALAGMALFDERFEALERSMKEAGDALEAEAMAAQSGAGSARGLATSVALSGLVMALLTALGLYAAVLHSIARPIAQIVETMRRRGSRPGSVLIPHRDRRDEIGEMARAIGSYQDVLAGRAAEEQSRRDEEVLSSQSQAATFAETAHQIRRAVDAAVHGDFSHRVDPGAQQGEMAALVTGINQINAAIDSATTTFADVLAAIADGDLTRTVRTDYSGKLGSVSGSINEMVEKLALTSDGDQADGARDRRSRRGDQVGAENLSLRTEEQASSLEETAATTEQLAASVKASANASRQAVHLAENATRVARNGGAIVTDAIGAMNRIEQASGKITDITSVIDGIAFRPICSR